MSRDQGFANADIDTSKHTDPKVSALWRALRDEAAMNAAMVLHEAVVLASWRDGARVPAEDAAPHWLTDVAGPAEALARAGLLDAEHKVPEHAWASWFQVAYDRREDTRHKWRDYKRQRRSASTEGPVGPHADSSPSYPPVPPVSSGSTVRPAVPPDRPTQASGPTAQAGFDGSPGIGGRGSLPSRMDGDGLLKGVGDGQRLPPKAEVFGGRR